MARNPASYVSCLTLVTRRMCESKVTFRPISTKEVVKKNQRFSLILLKTCDAPQIRKSFPTSRSEKGSNSPRSVRSRKLTEVGLARWGFWRWGTPIVSPMKPVQTCAVSDQMLKKLRLLASIHWKGGISWMWPAHSNSGKWRFIGIPY